MTLRDSAAHLLWNRVRKKKMGIPTHLTFSGHQRQERTTRTFPPATGGAAHAGSVAVWRLQLATGKPEASKTQWEGTKGTRLE
jgi:hypothetical protein